MTNNAILYLRSPIDICQVNEVRSGSRALGKVPQAEGESRVLVRFETFSCVPISLRRTRHPSLRDGGTCRLGRERL